MGELDVFRAFWGLEKFHIPLAVFPYTEYQTLEPLENVIERTNKKAANKQNN